ncbi:hypothetical protein HYPBUDRAFT_156521 [Hyphopichia burtonii NRRL Y-1933]|uniref:25S rRNA (Uridine(2843)-N(3))-methyltransferase n=1 Tax=Hyphopichia burtonii NRRL Y-1933 TaxID=984485 RepID=A0A1E4RKH3_9ASCO|nr:hypothetical protein HYPBUDRAFT_156521 [Hyphopichia burtonii NRRL Y-1933]ODV67777.1 hypothetical protein HYPBUDRAFT_156521 [Hyphopichia burtonii NRRL Y-1933]
MSRRIARRNLKKEKLEESVEEDEVERSVQFGAELKNDSIPFKSKYSQDPQKIIGLFEDAFKYILESPDLEQHIQSVKGDLFNRDYLAAFNNDDKRFAYASRWTPARALAYSSLFASLEPLRCMLSDSEASSKVLCVGGGAASELVGLGAVFCKLKQDYPATASNLHVDIVDIADWSTVVTNLTHNIKTKWLYDENKFNSKFMYRDILTMNATELDLANLDLVTLLFTTNELFCEKRTETIKFLQNLNTHCKKGGYLLIAESAGSYSNITIGNKKFPVQFLIDMVLIGKPGTDSGAWKIVQQSESCWYRVNQRELKYNMKLENMRFFFRLYQKK